MGCGRVGSTLARSLSDQGHDVAVIDSDPMAFRRLGSSFDGRTVTGMGFDRDTLKAAGTAEAYAFAAVSSGDNSNILAARVARETFGVENVAARIYDPARAMIYQRLGIPTVATVRWTAEQMMQRLLPKGSIPELTDPSGKVSVAQVPLHDAWIGERLTRLEEVSSSRVVYLTRLGEGVLPHRDTVYQAGDLVHLAVDAHSLGSVEAICAADPADLAEDPFRWRRHRGIVKVASTLTWVLVGLYAVRVAVMLPLYRAGEVSALGVSKIVLGWPAYLLALTAMGVVLLRGRTPLDEGERTPAG